MLRKSFIPVVIAVLAVMVWLLRPERDVADESVKEALPEVSKVELIQPEPEAPVQRNPVSAVENVDPPSVEHVVPEQVEEPMVSAEEATESMLPLIPGWLLESGDVRRERVQVAGQWMSRVRSRYAWSNGSLVEVEVTDLGADASVEQFKSLGFDFDLQMEVNNGALRLLDAGADYVSNLEYDEEDASGHVQYIVAGRYLMEIQLERLPLESFQSLEDRDGLFATLRQHALE